MHAAVRFCGVPAQTLLDECSARRSACFHQHLGGAFNRQLEQLFDIYVGLSFGREARIANTLSNLLITLICEES